MRQLLEAWQAAVTVTIEPGGRSHFDCPNCGNRITYCHPYPLSFIGKTCRDCRWGWNNTSSGFGIGPRADEIAGITHELQVVSFGPH